MSEPKINPEWERLDDSHNVHFIMTDAFKPIIVWNENTHENPFWREKGPVLALLDSGRIYPLSCPSCCKRMMPEVKKWRAMTAE